MRADHTPARSAVSLRALAPCHIPALPALSRLRPITEPLAVTAAMQVSGRCCAAQAHTHALLGIFHRGSMVAMIADSTASFRYHSKPCRIGMARSYGGGSVRRAQIIRPGSAGGLRAGEVSSRRPGALAVATPMLCREAICAYSEAPRTRRVSTTRHAAAGCLHWARLTRSEVPTTLCDSLLPSSCASEFRAVSARAARRQPRAVLEDSTPCATGLHFEHLGLL
jgi:hypothetical protein